VYGTSFFGDPMHIGGGRANRKELTEAGVTAITSAVPLEAAFAKGSMLVKGAVKGRVFWSGGDIAKNAAMDFAKANGMKTLEMTTRGKIMNTISPYLPRTISSPVWNNLSRGFAKGASEEVHFFYNAFRTKANKYLVIERPILEQNGVNIITH